MNDNQHSNVLKAIADETRLRLVRLLTREELNVQELCDILDMGQPRISRHLSVLRAINLVNDRREGTRMYYSLAELNKDLEDFSTYLYSVSRSEHPDLEKLESVLKKRTEISRDFVRGKAASWDEIVSRLHSPSLGLFTLASLLPSGLKIADLGCGTGLLLPILSKAADTVYAVDHSEEMIAFSRQRCDQMGLKNVEFIVSDFDNLNLHLQACDSLLLNFVLHQVASPQKLIKKLHPLLIPGGRLVIVDRLKHDDESVRQKFGSLWLGFEPEQLKQWFT